MRVSRLWLTGFRSYHAAEVSFAPGLTVVRGDNGQGKTNLVEAIGLCATLESFRGAPQEALVASGRDTAVVRAEVVHDDGREVLVELEIPRSGRVRVLVNRQRLARTADLADVVRVTVFSPDDLVVVKGGPSERRHFLDELVASLSPRLHRLRAEVERILRQRNALLKQAGGRLTPEIGLTLDVWDARFAEAGTALGDARATLVTELTPRVVAAYTHLADQAEVVLSYEPAWRAEGLGAALHAGRAEDLRRGVSLVGPHRDDVSIVLDGRLARTHASQGEQRSLALALRLGAHATVAERTRSRPVLVLDDVFSELDARRGEALLTGLPDGQVILTTAGALPAAVCPARVFTVSGGEVLAA